MCTDRSQRWDYFLNQLSGVVHPIGLYIAFRAGPSGVLAVFKCLPAGNLLGHNEQSVLWSAGYNQRRCAGEHQLGSAPSPGRLYADVESANKFAMWREFHSVAYRRFRSVGRHRGGVSEQGMKL